jgi:TPR repeat protein
VGMGVPRDRAQVIKYAMAGATNGNAVAATMIGHAYFDPGLGPPNQKEGLEWIRQATEQGDLEASVTLAAYEFEGTIIPRNVKAATNRILSAAQREYAPAMTLMAEVMLDGKLVPADRPAAQRWIKRAAELGHAPAQTMLADKAFAKPPELPFVDALRYYEMAAAQNWPRALAALAFLYGEGKGVARNEERSRDYLVRAARAREARAQFSLGVMLRSGNLGTTNQQDVLTLFRDSAEQGFPPGQNVYGYLLSRGEGTKRDIVEAWKWYELAAAAQDPNALVNMRNQRGDLTAEQIAEARRRASEFKPISRATPSYMSLPANPRTPR